jgi:hypothetical protein
MDKNQIQNLIKSTVQQEIQKYMTDKQFNLSKISAHQHNGVDSPLISTIKLQAETPINFGFGAMLSTSNSKTVVAGSTGEQLQASMVSGKDLVGAPVGTETNNLQLNLLHQPQNASNQSFINAFRPPVFGTIAGTTISVTSGASTVTITGHSFIVNALANALINIFDSTGTLVETQTIASNTSTVVTISGTWGATTTSGTYFIFQPVFMGSADTPFQRFYTQEGIGAGIRFGVGVTNGGQNGLLYMNSVGSLYWRNKSGVSTLIST